MACDWKPRGKSQSAKAIFPVPIDLLRAFMEKVQDKKGDKEI